MAKRKGLDLGEITKRITGEPASAETDQSQYKEPPNFVARRMDAQNNVVKGKREKRLTYRVDPAVCLIPEHHDRDYSALNEDNCRDLIEGIKAHGQETPAIVRTLEGVDGFQYELVCGSRRHWVTSYLKSDFIIEVRELSDEEAFIVSDEENRNRLDISDYERAKKYVRALGDLYKSQAQMAERMGVTKDWLSRYIDLGKLDPAIVKAYANLNEIKTNHARELKALMKEGKQAKRILSAANEMHNQPEKGAVVLSKLKAAAIPKPRTTKAVVKKYQGKNRKTFMQAKASTANKLTLEIDRTTGASIDDWVKAIQAAYHDYEQKK